MSIIELLEEDHRRVRALFAAFLAAHDPETGLRLGDALVLHACVEERFLYPLVRRALVGGDRLSDEAESDHEQVKSFVAEAEDTTGPALDELIDELQADVEVHMRWEEEDLFPRLVELVDQTVLQVVANRALAYMRVRLPVA
jgi:iron-sulfur cluster repair protein YtfE (RIC family)